MPERYGPWARSYDLFRRWQRDGIWQRIFSELQAQADAKDLITWDLNIDSTVCRAHQHAAGARKKGTYRPSRPAGHRRPDDHGLGRSRGGLTTKLHLAVEQGQRPMAAVITAGQRGDSTQLWPDRKLLITAMDVETREQEVSDRASGAPLPSAVAASTAFPGIYPPITINGRRYMDGSLRSATNAALAAGARTLVVIDPQAHLFPRELLHQELAVAAAHTVVTIEPDPASIRRIRLRPQRPHGLGTGLPGGPSPSHR